MRKFLSGLLDEAFLHSQKQLYLTDDLSQIRFKPVFLFPRVCSL